MTRRILHFTLGTVLWLVFFYYWHIVGGRPLNRQTLVALTLLGGLLAGSIAFLIWWIFHNIRIYRRLQRRRQRPSAEETMLKDHLGRWLVVDDRSGLKSAPYIEVEIKGVEREGKMAEEKVYRTRRPLPE